MSDFGIYDGLDEAEQFSLAMSIALNQLGVPPDDVAPTVDPDAPRRPAPDKSQGRGTAAPTNPEIAFAQRLQDVLDHPRQRWRAL